MATARAKLAKLDTQLERLTEAMLDDSGGTPAVFVRKARELEGSREKAEKELQAAERELGEAGRVNIVGAQEKWQQLTNGVEALHAESRQQARQLIADTFEQIVVYRVGVDPSTTPPGALDVLLRAKGGIARMLRVDRQGGWIAAAEFVPVP